MVCDALALRMALKEVKREAIDQPVFYILACRIGLFIPFFARRIRKCGGTLLLNPDGQEWKRRKWNAAIRRYWRYSEKKMISHADAAICDSRNIETSILEKYARYKPNTRYISYGVDAPQPLTAQCEEQFARWAKEHLTTAGEYYVAVGRLVPENNYDIIVREFMQSDTQKSLIMITTLKERKYMEKLQKNLNFEHDPRIQFAGTVYNPELLEAIRRHAFAYLHGHEVGGTNPSLLESMANTPLNILLDVPFNREVAEDAALYFTKESGSLRQLIARVEQFTPETCNRYAHQASQRMQQAYNWNNIITQYENLFLNPLTLKNATQ
jgi:rhamnosyltransferase